MTVLSPPECQAPRAVSGQTSRGREKEHGVMNRIVAVFVTAGSPELTAHSGRQCDIIRGLGDSQRDPAVRRIVSWCAWTTATTKPI
jgi:hypothetical protein